MGRWEENDSWSGEGLRREVFFFPCGGLDLYGSLYAAEPLSHRLGVAICNSWGIEADQANRLVHPLALSAARAGGAGLVFHYPGFGDSPGQPEAVTLGTMADAAAAALGEGGRRLPECDWMFAGFMLGASVAALALEQARPGALLLAQPALQPSEYFERLGKRARRIAGLTKSGEETVFGYSPSDALLASAAEADAAVGASLQRFQGPGAVVRYSAPKGTDKVPARFERVEVEGTWRFAAQDDSKLGMGVQRWLTEYMRRRG